MTHILVCGTTLLERYPDDFKYRKIYIEDYEEQDIIQYFEENYEFILKAIESGGRILIHW